VNAGSAGQTITNTATISVAYPADSIIVNNSSDAPITVSSGTFIYLPVILRGFVNP
jgi:hypothetical protein